MLITSTLVGAHGAALAALAARRAWIHQVRPSSIQGSDRFMLRWARREGARSYGYFTVSFGSRTEEAFAEVCREIRANLAEQLAQPRSSWRRGVDVDRGEWVWRDSRSMDSLVDDVHDDRAFFEVGDPRQRDIVVRFHHGRRLFGVLFDHTCWDGIRVVNECLAPVITARPFSSRWLVRDQYVPAASELGVLYTAYKHGFRALTYRTVRKFPVGHGQTVVKHVWRTAELKALKDRLGVTFSAAIVARFGRMVLDWLPPDRERVRIGVIVGFLNERFRNNYSMLAIDVLRKDDLDAAVRRVSRQMKRRRVEVLGLYHLVSTFEVESLFKANVVDALFSPAFFDPDTGLSLDVIDMSFFNVPSSTPLYAFACSIGDRITVCTTNNCADVDPARLTEGSVQVFEYDGHARLDRVRPALP